MGEVSEKGIVHRDVKPANIALAADGQVQVLASRRVSGGGVLNQQGDLAGIPVGRMQGDFRFSCILPLRSEMLRKGTGFSLRVSRAVCP